MFKTVAIVGRPNVGKSSLFNKLTGRRQAIVHNSPGVTRDRIYGNVNWAGKTFTLIDTGGLDLSAQGIQALKTDDLKSSEEFNSSYFVLSHIKKQVDYAVSEAEAIIMLCDIKSGVTSADEQIAHMLLRAKKPIILAVNKCDATGNLPAEIFEFYSLALGEPFAVSSIHGHGTGDLLEEIISNLSFEEPKNSVLPESDHNLDDENENKILRICVVGKPNVGKSTLVNKLACEERVIVSEKSGTTRDSIDTLVEISGKSYILVDTAGIRKKSKFKNISEDGSPEQNQLEIEKYSIMRALDAIDRSDVCIIMLDVNSGFTEQDSKIAGYAHEHGKPSVIVMNKWDSIEKQTGTMESMRKELSVKFAFMSYVPFAFISAKNGAKLEELFKQVTSVYEQCSRRISTGLLNEVLAQAIKQSPPHARLGQRLKIYYITQTGTNPPVFVVFCNNAEIFHFSYKRYIENQIRSNFGLNGTPLKIIVREREKKV